MSKEMSEQEVAIISALAGSVVETLESTIGDAVYIINDYVQLLVDAELVEEGANDSIIRMALQLAVDSIVDSIDEEDESDSESEDEDKDEDEDCTKRAY